MPLLTWLSAILSPLGGEQPNRELLPSSEEASSANEAKVKVATLNVDFLLNLLA